jgi:(2R)-3-sulfolactate dehydrogenase (NADP+)
MTGGKGMAQRVMSLTEVEELAFRALCGVGTRAFSARSMARAVAAAEGDGIRSHGLRYVPTYCDHVRCNKVDGSAEPQVTRPLPAVVRVDAACGFAHPAIEAGYDALFETAKSIGCSTLTVYNSYNCGVLGYHVERLAEAGLLALGFTNAPASIAPVGGRTPVIGTNPFAVAVPGGHGDVAIVIDQSASTVAKSEIMMRAREGRSIPLGWAYDSEGQPTTDAEAALRGSMAPSGGYKGFGVGLLVELMAAALSGATLAKDASPFSGTTGGPPRTGQCFIALAPDPLSGGAFASRVNDLVKAITEQDGARLPGARRMENRKRAARDGVQVDLDLIDRIGTYVA